MADVEKILLMRLWSISGRIFINYDMAITVFNKGKSIILSLKIFPEILHWMVNIRAGSRNNMQKSKITAIYGPSGCVKPVYKHRRRFSVRQYEEF